MHKHHLIVDVFKKKNEEEYFVAEAMQSVLNIALICGKCLLNALHNFCCKTKSE